MMWFETGRVNFYLVGRVSLGMAKQLVCNGFFQTGLIFDYKVFESVLETINHSSEHRVFDIAQPLPKKIFFESEWLAENLQFSASHFLNNMFLRLAKTAVKT